METVRRSIRHEPRPADAPPIGRLDWLLAGVFAAAALVGWSVAGVLSVFQLTAHAGRGARWGRW